MTMITPSYLGETIEYSSLHACRSTLEDPKPGGEIERQVADPFEYAAEDALVARWRASRDAFGPAQSPLPEQGHQYRHPKAPGEAWSAGPGPVGKP